MAGIGVAAHRCRRAVVALLLVFQTPVLAAAESEAQFHAGMSAYQAGDYATAARAFERARTLGLQRPALDYNLGSTYFRLGEYERAAEAFERLRSAPAMEALAHYNLGLVRQRQGESVLAHYHFRAARDLAGDPRLRYLAARQIDETDGAAWSSRRDWRAYGFLSAGYDDNVNFVPTDTPTYRGDNFVEGYLSGSGVLSGTRGDGVSMHGSLYALRYRDSDESEFSELWLLARRNATLGDWRTYAGGFALHDVVAGDDYQRGLGLETGARREVRPDRFVDLRYVYEDITSLDERYDYLEGQRHELRAEYGIYEERDSLRLAYELELNDRRDTALESYSPTRHTLRAYYSRDLDADWRLRADASYRLSEYPGAPRLERLDKRWRTRISATRSLTKDWKLKGQWEYTDNQSNDPLRDYQRQVYSLQLEWLY